ncbi:MAG: ATP-binding protein, partial [bacterium]
MEFEGKGISPFYPGHPVPVELFVGRQEEINRIDRAAYQVSSGKQQSIFITGEYGIGKSSIAKYIRAYCEDKYDLIGIHSFLGNSQSIEDITERTMTSFIEAKIINQNRMEIIRNSFSKYVHRAELFGLQINTEALKTDLPDLSKGFLSFLKNLYERLAKEKVKGLVLIFDEINGVSKNPEFAHFIKNFVDDNAINYEIPILLILCGVRERLGDMIKNHQPVERIFQIAELSPLSKQEMEIFFTRSFQKIDVHVNDDALEFMCRYSAGFPKIMHIIGEEIYWVNNDDI